MQAGVGTNRGQTNAYGIGRALPVVLVLSLALAGCFAVGAPTNQRVFDNLGSNDPETSALALAKSKIELATFSRNQEFEADGIGVGIAARAGYDPYGAVRFLTSMGRNSELKPSARVQLDPRAPDF